MSLLQQKEQLFYDNRMGRGLFFIGVTQGDIQAINKGVRVWHLQVDFESV
jgi:hypothetical protein